METPSKKKPKARRVRAEVGGQPIPLSSTTSSTQPAEADDQQLISQKLRQAIQAQRQLLSSQQKKDVTALRANVSSALTQALHSEDYAMVDKILHTTSTSTSAQVRLDSIEKLNPALALGLLRRCCQLFQLKSSQAQEVLPWIRDILKLHSVFLTSQPEVTTEVLAPVSHVIKEHLATYDRLRLLQGRLELLLSRIPHLPEVPVDPVPLYCYQEQDEEKEEGEGENTQEVEITPEQLLQIHQAQLKSVPIIQGKIGSLQEDHNDSEDDDDDDDDDDDEEDMEVDENEED